MKKKAVVATEVAEVEFNRFIELMDIDVATDDMDVEDKKSFSSQKSLIVNAIVKGAMVVNDNGEPVYTPQRVKDSVAITFYEPTGAALMAMDRRKKTEDIAKMYASMAEITKTSSKTFASMKMSDLKVCMAVITFFLG